MNGLMAAPGGEVCPAVLPAPFPGLGDDITSNSVVCCVYKLPPHRKHSVALLPGAKEDVSRQGSRAGHRGALGACRTRCPARPPPSCETLHCRAAPLPSCPPQEPVVTDADLPTEQPLWHAAPRRGGGPPGGGPPRAMLGDPAHRMLQHSMQLGRQFPGSGVQPGYAPGAFRPGPPQQQQFGFQPAPPQQGYGFRPAPMQPQFGMQPPQHGYQQPPAMQQQQFGGGGFGQPRPGAKFTGGSFGGPPPVQPAGYGFTPAPPAFRPGMQQGQFGAPPAYGQQAPPAFGAPPQQPYGQPPPQQFYGQPAQQPRGPPQQGGFAHGNPYAALQRRQ